ncbi:HAD family hydrolase [Nocardioides sp. B-3]|uniref:HAD family hydrolase n=1 Tax=Nocardioides sp. B-3 TaxID=2895565 RepID=UPI002153A023|nr:HAD-IB family hydrolase [Nocardioides sp. B-3]UUZ60066.1 HAD-IB family hydrolase [Nocardioides sp. B-3]
MNPDDLIAEIEAGPRGSHIAAFFDLDGTLVSGFTATHILRDQLRKGRVGAGDLAKLVLTAVDGTLGGDPTRAGDLGLASLRGHLVDAMEEMGDRLFVQKIAGTIRPQARAIVKAHQRMGHVVVLASAATRFQTGPVARELGIDDILCTELEVEDGVLTGRVVGKFLWGEPKARAVRRFAREHDVDLAQSYGYANGDEDVAFPGQHRPPAPDRARPGAAGDRQLAGLAGPRRVRAAAHRGPLRARHGRRGRRPERRPGRRGGPRRRTP